MLFRSRIAARTAAKNQSRPNVVDPRGSPRSTSLRPLPSSWLQTGGKEAAGLLELLRPYPAEEMTATAVGFGVNNPRFDGPACIEPIKP